jgi:hypothetical protein
VSETNRTPDEPGRGSVATGQHPAPPHGSSKGGANGAGSGNGHVVDAPTEEARLPRDDDAPTDAAPVTADDAPTEAAPVTPDEPPTEAAPITADDDAPTDAAPVTTDDPPTEAAPVTTNGRPVEAVPAPLRGGPDGIASSVSSADAEAPVSSEAATTRLRLPTANGDAPRTDPMTPEAADVGTAAAAPPKADGARPNSAPAAGPVPPTLDPLPAPAVPAPGPGAAQPPPWRRMPGQEAPDRPDDPAPTVADGLLNDGPTAFLEAPRTLPPPAPGASADSAAAEPSGWPRAVRTRPPRQAALQLKRLDPWSVLKLALVLAVVLFFIWLVAVGVLYGALDGLGVWDRLNGTYADLVSGEAQTGSTLISAGRVFGLAAVIGAINSLLFAVAVTVGAFVYNVSADLVGGIEVTLSERD